MSREAVECLVKMSPIETRILELLNSVETEKFNFCQGPRGMSRPILSRKKKNVRDKGDE